MTEASQGIDIQSLAAELGATIRGSASSRIVRASRINYALEGSVTFYSNAFYSEWLTRTRATCILVAQTFTGPFRNDTSYLAVKDPYKAFVRCIELLHRQSPAEPVGVHPSAVVGQGAVVAPTAAIGAYCVIGEGTVIDDDVVVMPHVVIGKRVRISQGAILHPFVSIYDDTSIGRDCVIHSGAVIGSIGFGFIEESGKPMERIRHVGHVELGDGVEVGANTCIDRSVTDATTIHDGVKLDNLIHVAHNVEIGQNTAIAAQAGIAGSAHIGQNARIGGQVGVVGHSSLGDGIVVHPQAGVSKSLKTGRYIGSPARDYGHFARQEASLRSLPDLLKEYSYLKNTLADLVGKVEQLSRVQSEGSTEETNKEQ